MIQQSFDITIFVALAVKFNFANQIQHGLVLMHGFVEVVPDANNDDDTNNNEILTDIDKLVEEIFSSELDKGDVKAEAEIEAILPVQQEDSFEPGEGEPDLLEHVDDNNAEIKKGLIEEVPEDTLESTDITTLLEVSYKLPTSVLEKIGIEEPLKESQDDMPMEAPAEVVDTVPEQLESNTNAGEVEKVCEPSIVKAAVTDVAEQAERDESVEPLHDVSISSSEMSDDTIVAVHRESDDDNDEFEPGSDQLDDNTVYHQDILEEDSLVASSSDGWQRDPIVDNIVEKEFRHIPPIESIVKETENEEINPEISDLYQTSLEPVRFPTEDTLAEDEEDLDAESLKEELEKAMLLGTLQETGTAQIIDAPLIYVAYQNYEPESDEVLPLHEGEKVEVLDNSQADWWLVHKLTSSDEGWVPGQYLKELMEYEQMVVDQILSYISLLPIDETSKHLNKPGFWCMKKYNSLNI